MYPEINFLSLYPEFENFYVKLYSFERYLMFRNNNNYYTIKLHARHQRVRDDQFRETYSLVSYRRQINYRTQKPVKLKH